jgi:hypothetical protein
VQNLSEFITIYTLGSKEASLVNELIRKYQNYWMVCMLICNQKYMNGAFIIGLGLPPVPLVKMPLASHFLYK